MSLKLHNKKIHLCISVCADTRPSQSQNSEEINWAVSEKGHKSTQIQRFSQQKCVQYSLEVQTVNDICSLYLQENFLGALQSSRAINSEQKICFPAKVSFSVQPQRKSLHLLDTKRGQDGSLAIREKFLPGSSLQISLQLHSGSANYSKKIFFLLLK